MQISTKSNLIIKIQKGDTVSSICSKYKLDINQFKQLNNIDSIVENDIVLLSKSFEHCYIVKPLDTPQKIANSLGVDLQKIENVTKGKKMFIGQKILF